MQLTHRAADAPQRDPLQEKAFNQRALVCGNQALVSLSDKLALTHLALVILFAIMDVTIFLELLRSTLGASVSRNHSSVQSPFDWSLLLANSSMKSSESITWIAPPEIKP